MTNWNILQLDVKPAEGDLTDVVITAHWDCVASEDGYSGRVYGSCKTPHGNPNKIISVYNNNK